MKFALVDGKKLEATHSATGICVGCGSDLIAKCGEVRIWHWAHKGSRHCDQWWENETEWHRGWKGHFPIEWQEIIHQADVGERHIADVKTGQGWVLEFQYSYLNPEERRARDAFYPKLVWVVNGERRTRDKLQFHKAWEEGRLIGSVPWMRSVFSSECRLLQEWAKCSAPVFFDFGEVNKSLWCLLPDSSVGNAYIVAFSREDFIKLHRDGVSQMGQDLSELLGKLKEIISGDIARRQAQTFRPLGFQQYIGQRARFRRRF